MRYINAPQEGQILTFAEAFGDFKFGDHGKSKVGFGSNTKSDANPTSVCVSYNAGNRLLEVADYSTGDSVMGNTAGGDRNVVIADKPYALAEDTDCHILGLLEYRQSGQPKLYTGADLEEIEGGASRFTSFVSATGAAGEDPKPQKVSDTEGQREVNRETGHAAYGDYFVHVYRLAVNEGQAYASLTLEASGHTPQTDTTFEEPEAATHSCPKCGHTF